MNKQKNVDGVFSGLEAVYRRDGSVSFFPIRSIDIDKQVLALKIKESTKK